VITVVTDESLPEFVADDLLERAAEQTLTHESFQPPSVDLTIVQTGDAEIQTLNRDYLGHDAPTDVLSFPSNETDPESGTRYLGDVVISIPRAKEQARQVGHSLEAEVQLLVVHGVLHLLGHDHAEADEKALMWAAQREILGQLGQGGISVRES
jgi:probable rRNA maturation factor